MINMAVSSSDCKGAYVLELQELVDGLLARARLERAFMRANQDHGIAGAVAEVGDFTIDPVALQRDLADFRVSGDNF
ncbi:hypothetical protein B484DRAFT_396813 [Ochromonadaceae sp. CCMP2298]|nr:hypothetical protein B484DRAFT_396813 [Ochromonadaceae sp. CCMP2298]